MNKTFKIILVISIICGVVISQSSTNSSSSSTDPVCDSSQNTLLQSSANLFGPVSSGSVQTVSGLNYCKQLEGKQSCCSVATINGLKDKVQQSVQDINSKAKDNDNRVKSFVQAASQLNLEAQTLNQTVQNISDATNSNSRILLQIFERVLQQGSDKGQGGNGSKPGNDSRLGNDSRPGNGSGSNGQGQGGNGQKPGNGSGPNGQGQGGNGSKQQTAQLAQGLFNKGGNQSQPQGQNGQQSGQKDGKAPNLSQAPKGQNALENIKQMVGVGKGSPEDMKNLIGQTQQARVQCLKFLNGLKSKFNCLACDYAQIQSAQSSGSLILGSSMCSDIQSNCYQYALLNQNVSLLRNSDQIKNQVASTQQQRLAAQQVAGNLSKLNQAISDKGANDSSANQALQLVQNAAQQLGAQQSSDSSLNTTFQAKQLPANCTSNTSCDYLCGHFVNLLKGGIDFDNAQNPGQDVSIDITNSIQLKQLQNKQLQGKEPSRQGDKGNDQKPGNSSKPNGQGQGGNSSGPIDQGKGGNGSRPGNSSNQTIPGKRILAQLSDTVKFSPSAAPLSDSGLETEAQSSIQQDPSGVASMDVNAQASLTNIVDSQQSNANQQSSSNNGKNLNIYVALIVLIVAAFFY